VIAAYSAHRPNSATAALGIHLIVYCCVGACLASGLYAVLQPWRAPNSGLAAYKPPAGAVVTYGKSLLPKSVAETIAPVTLIEPEPAMTARSTPEPELKPTVTAPSQPHADNRSHRKAKRPNREVKMESPKRQGAPCIPGYDSAGAQTRPCG
jgi:hypothetical protein